MADEIITFDEILADPIYKAEFDRRITKALSTVQSKLEAEAKKVRELTERLGDNGEETVEVLKEKISKLQNKYEADIADRDYSDAVARAIADKGIKFSSKAAEKAYIADLKAKKLPLKDGALDGFEEYHKAQLAADPTAFQTDKPTPTIVKPVGAGGPPAGESKGAMYAKQFNAQYAPTKKE